ncbi:uncharacterized protein LOC135144578 [Zophobas morio]|uniref:uncharacterized protein LOC135144578 n=1 Tax=Zophobas morio TaxID=2755281 RepID=UPI003083DD68
MVDTSSVTTIVSAIDLVIVKCTVNMFIFFLAAVYVPSNISTSDFELFLERLEPLLLGKPVILLPLLREDLYHPALGITAEFVLSSKRPQFPSLGAKCYNFKKANFVNLYNDIFETEWSSLSAYSDVNAAVTEFYRIFYNILDPSVPLYSLKKSSYTVWFNKQIIKTLKMKNYYRKKWKKTSSAFYHIEFKRLRALAKQLIRLGHDNYLREIEQSIHSTPKNLWKYVRSKKGTTRIPGKITYNGNVSDDPQKIVDMFAEKFSNVYLSGANTGIPDIITNKLSFSMQPVTEEQLVEVIIFLFGMLCARITPIFKKGDKSDVNNNYRPISILSNFAKVFELVIYRNILCNVDVIYTDFSSAFDSINHSILLQKLSAFGFTSSFLKLIASYLINRINFVFYNGFTSFSYVGYSGVPQGSNLGPLLFTLFINDLLASMKCKILAYADDIKLYASINSESDYINFQAQLNLFIDGCQFLQLRLNPDKCFYLTYTKKREIVKDLGVTFDPQLSFIEHISDICLTSSKMLGFIYRTTISFMNPCFIKTLYFAFLVSKLEYASILKEQITQIKITKKSTGVISQLTSIVAVNKSYLTGMGEKQMK